MDERDNNPEATKAVYADIPEPTGTPELEPVEEQVIEPEVEPVTPDEIEEAPEEVEENPRTAKSRIREQSQQINKYEGTLDDLTGLNSLGNPIFPNLDIKPGEEITPDQYQEHVGKTAAALVDLKIAANNNAIRIKDELRESMTDYPELNPKQKENFDAELSDSISEAVRGFIRSNPTGNVKKYVDSLMKPYKNAIEKKVAASQQTVAKNASAQALRPTQVNQPTKKFEELSLAEMEKKLGKVF